MNQEVRRRVYLVGLALGIPTLPVVWLTRGPDDPVMRIAYPLFALYLVGVAFALATRRMAVPTSERQMVVAVALFELVRLIVAVFGSQDLTVVTAELMESTFWNVVVVFILAYLAYETRVALRISLGFYAVIVVVLLVRVVPDLAVGASATEAVTYLRVMAFHGVFVVLLYGLAHVKEQLVEERSHAQDMTRLAHTDVLTGLPNRRALQETLDQRLADAQRYDRPLSLLMLDLDLFKSINDRHGHPVGDAVLRDTAVLLTSVLRTSDLIGRWGGEEFVVIAPETDQAAAEQLAERCRAELADHVFEQVTEGVTASIGVASFRPHDTARDLVKRADDGLYEAKRAGRNRVELAV
jgi:diguanylate cyclase